MFITPCVIYKNTQGLRERLKEFGYLDWSCDDKDIGVAVGNFNFRLQSYSLPDKLDPCIIGIGEDEDFTFEEIINCGTNEDLFLALAALRDDSDRFQWFVKDGNWIFSETDSFPDNSYHKATPPELIKKFNDRNQIL